MRIYSIISTSIKSKKQKEVQNNMRYFFMRARFKILNILVFFLKLLPNLLFSNLEDDSFIMA